MKSESLNIQVVLRLVLMAAIAACFTAAMCPPVASPAYADAMAPAFGETVAGAISAPGEADSYTIVANAGDVVLIRVSKDGGDLWPQIRLYAPAGALLQEQDGSTAAEMVQSVPESGSYSLLISDGYDGTYTGSYKLYVQRLNQPGNALALTFGQTVTGAIPQAAEMDTFTFEAEVGDVILVGMSRTSGSLWPEIRVYNAAGSALGATSGTVHAELTVTAFQTWRVYLPVVVSGHTGAEIAATRPEAVQRVEVTVPGAYTILVGDDYNATYTGSYNVHLQRLNNPGNATALSFGQTVAGSISMPGEMDAYTFSGEAGDVVLAGMSLTSGSLWPQVRVYDPNGNPVGTASGSAHAEVVATLPVDGSYLLLACDGYNGTYTGSYNVHLQRLNNPGNATPLSFGQTLAGSISVPGEMDAYTFAGQVGDVVLAGMSKTSGDLWPQVRVYDPNGNPVGTASGSAHTEVVATLPVDGTYLLLACDGYNGTYTGSYNVHLQRLNNPGNATPLSFGETLAGSISVPGEMDAYTFSGEAGDIVLAGMSKTSGTLWPQVRVYDPNGNPVGSTSGSAHAEVVATLPVDGTYLLLACDGYNGTYTGSYNVHLQRLNNPGNATPLSFGQTLAGSINMAGEMDAYTFSGEAGDVVLAGMSKTSGTLWPQVRVYDPNGNPVGSTSGSAHTEVVATLPVDGTYLLLACDGYNGTYTGSYNVHLQRLNNPGNATPLSFGETLAGSINMAGEMDAYTFSGEAGDVVLAGMSKTSGDLWPQVRVYDPNGNPVGSTSGSAHTEVVATLPVDGTYLLLACDGYNGTYTGSYNVHLQRLNNPGNATALSFGQTLAGSINMAGEMDAYTFAGQAGQSILISMSRTSGNLWPQIRLYDDDGNPVGSASGSSSADLVVTLSADGTYTILVDDGYNGTYTGGYNLHLEQTTRRGDKPW